MIGEELPFKDRSPLADPVGWLLAHQDAPPWALVALFVGVALLRAGYLLLPAVWGPRDDDRHGRG